MTERAQQLEQIAEYVQYAASMLGLADWHLIVDDELPDDEEHDAAVQVIYGQRRAHLRFAAGFGEWEQERLRRVVVHELVHCHFEPLDEHHSVLCSELGSSARMIAGRLWTGAFERAIDDIATAWAPRLRLHHWEEPDIEF